MNERVKGLMNEWMNRRINEWMNGWILPVYEWSYWML